MPLGAQLSTIRTQLKAEIRTSLDTSTISDTEYNAIINGVQDTLCLKYVWVHLDTKADVSVSGQTATLPSALNLEHSFSVHVKQNGQWFPLEFGIGIDEYNIYDSDSGVTADPIQRWKYATSTTFEVWPIPATTQTVRFWGQAKPTVLDGDSDVANLDDLLLAYFAAAELCLAYKQNDAAFKLQKATDRLNLLRHKTPIRDNPIVIGGCGDEPKPRILRIVG